MSDAPVSHTELWRSAGYLEIVREQLAHAVSVLQQPPPATLWWGASRREYEDAAGELARVMQRLSEEIAIETQLQQNLAATAHVCETAALGAFW